MLELQTERLRLLALNPGELDELVQNAAALERRLGLEPGIPRDPLLERELWLTQLILLEKIERSPRAYLWNTQRLIVVKAENRRVGGFCFKGPPNQAGEVEIGYGTDPADQRQGYMTEAVAEAARWALSRPRVKAVIAETHKDNVPSHRVLEKNGFTRYRETELFYYWKLTRKR
jgi:RimJ/RimL family protein N-acetyltransferase